MLIPKEPLRIALIGAGHRSNTIYMPLFASPNPWFKLVAVCDPVREHAQAYAEALGVRACYDIHELVRQDDIEAAVVVTPIESHHALSTFLSAHGIHNLVETTWCSTVLQARQMIEAAKKNKVYTRVAENFFRYPIDRFAQTLRDDGYIGKIGRILTYNDHTGYHSNSRWLVFAGEYPEWVQCVDHTMPTMHFYENRERWHESETFRARFIQFPSGLMVVDQAANIKSMLGRQARPGFTEWHGARGALVQQGYGYGAPRYTVRDNNRRVERGRGVHSDWCAEIRCCDYPDTGVWNEETKPGNANVICKVERYYDERGRWAGVHASTPEGVLDYVNELRPETLPNHYYPEYGVCVMGHLVDFAMQVRGVTDSEFNEQDALMSQMMEMAARESALHSGARVRLPLDGELEADALMLKKIGERYGVDPLDTEAMLSISYPKP